MADQTKKIVHQNIIRERANTARGDSHRLCIGAKRGKNPQQTPQHKGEEMPDG